MMRALGHDFVLRRNIRIGFATCGKDSTIFLKWTYGSHHTRLVTHIASTWNGLLGRKTIRQLNLNLNPRPMLQAVNCGEKFGLVASDDAMTFGGLIDMNDIKKEEPHEELLDLMLRDSDEVEHVLCGLNIDPALLSAPAITPISRESHPEGTTRHDLASESSICPPHASHAKNLEMLTRRGSEADLAIIVSYTSCTWVHLSATSHAYMPGIKDLTNDGPMDGLPQNTLKRKLKSDDNDNDDNRPIDPKRTCMAADTQETRVWSFIFSSFYFVDCYLTLTDCDSSCSDSKHCGHHC